MPSRPDRWPGGPVQGSSPGRRRGMLAGYDRGVRVQAERSAGIRRRTRASAVSPSGAVRAALGRLRAAGRRPLLDPRDSVLRRHEAPAGVRVAGADAAPAAGSADPGRAYPLLYPLLDITTTLDPRFNIAYRFGAVFLAEPFPGGPGRPDLAVALLEKGLRERPDKWEYMQDIGFVHYWYRHDYRAAAAVVRQGERRARRAVVAPLAGGDDAGPGRRSPIVAADVEGDSPVGRDRLAASRTPSVACSQLRALDEIDACSSRSPISLSRTGQPPADWQALVRAGVVPGVPVDPGRYAVRADSDGRVRLSRSSPLWPLPEEPAAARHGRLMTDMSPVVVTALPVAVAAAFGAIVGSFLNVCIYRLPLGKSIVWPASACPRCGRPLSWYENIPVVSYLALRGRCRTCREPISIRYPIVEALTAAMFALRLVVLRPGRLLASRLVFGCALIVLFAIDLEHQLLPNAITLPGIVRRLRVQPLHRAGLAVVADRHPGRRRRPAASRSATPTSGCGTRKASAWATSRCWR